jgi:hypothetical protein
LNTIIIEMSLTSTLNLASTTPLEKEELRKMKTILQMLMDNPDSTEFRTPVDWEGKRWLMQDWV